MSDELNEVIELVAVAKLADPDQLGELLVDAMCGAGRSGRIKGSIWASRLSTDISSIIFKLTNGKDAGLEIHAAIESYRGGVYRVILKSAGEKRIRGLVGMSFLGVISREVDNIEGVLLGIGAEVNRR